MADIGVFLRELFERVLPISGEFQEEFPDTLVRGERIPDRAYNYYPAE